MPLHTAVTITSLDGTLAFHELCETLIVNLHGCALQSPRPLKIGAGVQLEVGRYRVTGRVVDLASIGTTSWMIGIALNQPGNIWGIPNPPEDWSYALPRSIGNAPESQAQESDGCDAENSPAALPDTGNDDIRDRVARLEKLQSEELTTLREERAKSQAVREATQKAAAEQLERLRQARAYIESLACSLPASIESQAQQQAKILLQQLRQDLEQEVSLRISTTIDGLEGRLRSTLLQTTRQVRDEVVQQLESPQRKTDSASISELRAMQAAMRHAARQFTADLGGQSERAQAELRQLMQSLLAETQTQVDQRDNAAKAALQAVGANLLAGMRQQLLADLAQEQARQAAQQPAREPVISPETLEQVSKQLREELRTQLQESFAERERTFATAQSAAASQLQQVTEQLRTQLQESFAERERAFATAQSAAASELQQVTEHLRTQLQASFGERERTLETAQSAATSQLQQLQKQIEELTGVVDVELQSHAEETVREAVAQARQELQQACADLREAQLGQARTELDGRFAAVLEQAGRTSDEMVRRTMESLAQQISKYQNTGAELQQEIEQSRRSLAGEMAQFQETVHNTLVEAGGEIRGRIQQAVSSAVEPLEALRSELQQQMAALAEQHTEDLRRRSVEFAQQSDNLQQRVMAGCEQSRAAAETGLQQRLAEMLDAFTKDLQRLSQDSTTGWQKAMSETLAAVPVLLAQKLPRQP